MKSKSQDCCVTFKPKNYLEILFSVHARTSQANILLLGQKAAKCTTCKGLYGKFWLFIMRGDLRQYSVSNSIMTKLQFPVPSSEPKLDQQNRN